MTWAQGNFAYCFVILAPAAGVICATRRKRDGRSGFKGFVSGAGAMLLALVACVFIAHWLFPHYPRQRIPEIVANAFTVPAVAAGIWVIWFISRKTEKRFRRIACAVFALLYVGGFLLSYEFCTWGFRKALPWSASNVHEWYWEDGFLPDYHYNLKAKITAMQFQRYISKFDLTPHTPERIYPVHAPGSWLSWHNNRQVEGDWWDPSPSLESTSVRRGHRGWILAKYERGYLYLESVLY